MRGISVPENLFAIKNTNGIPDSHARLEDMQNILLIFFSSFLFFFRNISRTFYRSISHARENQTDPSAIISGIKKLRKQVRGEVRPHEMWWGEIVAGKGSNGTFDSEPIEKETVYLL